VTDHPGKASPGLGRRLLRPGPIIAVVLVIVVLLFVLQNRETVQITVFALNLTAPLWLLTVVTAALGAAIGYLAARRRE
jgi:uncharacterized integral membrane protein